MRTQLLSKKDLQTWVATVAFQIGMRWGQPIIVVNPQVCVDRKVELEAEIARLEQELAAEAGKVNPFDENGEPQTAAALAEAGLA